MPEHCRRSRQVSRGIRRHRPAPTPRRPARLASPLAVTAVAAALTLGVVGPPAVGVVATQSDPSAAPDTIPRIESDRVVLRWLDKSTARVDQIAVPVATTIALGGLDVTVRACRRTAPDQAPEHAAFLEVHERRPGEAPRKIFQGWMFASSPSLSALEHPVYDVWVLECADDAGEAAPDSAASSDATAAGSQ